MSSPNSINYFSSQYSACLAGRTSLQNKSRTNQIWKVSLIPGLKLFDFWEFYGPYWLHLIIQILIIIIHRQQSRRPQGFYMHDDHQQVRQSAFLALLLHYPQSLYIGKVWGTWSTRSLFANGWYVQSISSSRLFLYIRRLWPRNFSWRCPIRWIRVTVLVME